jgi:hypothetical protein
MRAPEGFAIYSDNLTPCPFRYSFNPEFEAVLELVGIDSLKDSSNRIV